MSEFNIEIGDLSEKDRAERKGYPVKIKPKFKNMKIEINADQPLGEVCAELLRLGFSYDAEMSGLGATSAVGVWCEDMTYCTYGHIESIGVSWSTTLAELKEMGREDD